MHEGSDQLAQLYMLLPPAVTRAPQGQPSHPTRMPNHHCSYFGCTKMKDNCKKHYWRCSGTADAPHDEQTIFQGAACESQVRRNGKVEICGLKEQ